MLRVRIEMCPFGDERPEAVREIGRMYIANDGDKSRESGGDLGDYTVAVCRRGTTAVPKPLNPKGKPPVRGGEIRDYPRLALSVWRLIARALHVAYPEEAKPAKRTAGDRPALSPEVMAGLQVLAANAPAHLLHHDDVSQVSAALEWLDAANLRKD
jgi:hypothetical protein